MVVVKKGKRSMVWQGHRERQKSVESKSSVLERRKIKVSSSINQGRLAKVVRIKVVGNWIGNISRSSAMGSVANEGRRQLVGDRSRSPASGSVTIRGRRQLDRWQIKVIDSWSVTDRGG